MWPKGTYFKQDLGEFDVTYGLVIAHQKNGSVKGVTFTSFAGSFGGKAAIKSLRNWNPRPQQISPNEIPPKILAKIDAKAKPYLSETLSAFGEGFKEFLSYREQLNEGSEKECLDFLNDIEHGIKRAKRELASGEVGIATSTVVGKMARVDSKGFYRALFK